MLKYLQSNLWKVFFAMWVMVGINMSWAQISIGGTSAVTENFNTMSTTSATGALPTNWKMSAAGAGGTAVYTTAANTSATTVIASSGSTPTNGGRYNFGDGTTNTDRSPGFLTSGSYNSPNSIMAFYKNGNTAAISQLTVSYDIERYRRNTAAASAAFSYSINGTTWVAVPAGNISFTTDTLLWGYPLDSQNASVTITGLTIAANANFYLRWNFDTTGASSQGLGLDNVSVTATFANTPVYTLTPTALTGFTYVQGSGPSAAQNFSLSGSNLTSGGGNITVTGSTNFQVSADNSAWGTTATITYTGTSLSSTNVYVRLKAGLTQGSYPSETINISGGGATGSLTASGTVTSNNQAPVASNVTTTGSSYLVGATLGSTYTYSDNESDAQGTSTYKWYTASDISGTGNAVISGATSSSFTLTSTQLGKYIRVGVTPVATTGTTTGTEAFSSWVGPVVAPSLTITGTQAHGTQCVGTAATFIQYTITNSGTATASGITVVSSNAAEFAVSGLSSTTIAANGTATFNVTFTPNGANSRSATITVNSTTSGSNAPTRALSGTGTAAAAPTVTANAANPITTTGATISGTATVNSCSTAVTSYGVEYSTSSAFTSPIVVEGTNLSAGSFSVNLTGLSPATMYYYRTYGENTTGKTYSTPTSSFVTACTALSLPFAEGFENTTFPPTCWAVFNGTNNLGTNSWGRWTGSYSEGTASASVQADNVTNGTQAQDWLVTPGLIIPSGNASSLKFHIRPSSSDNNNDSKFYIRVSSTSQTTHASFSTTLATYDANTFDVIGEFYEKEISLSAFAGQTIYIAFVAESDAGLTWGIDDVSVKQSKAEPSGQATAASCGTNTSTSTTINFTAATGTVLPDGYIVKWSTTGYEAITTPVDGTTEANGNGVLNVTGTTATATGLSAFTPYYFRIWSYTNSGSVINYNLVSPLETICSTADGPCLSQDFESISSFPTGWTATNVTITTISSNKLAEFASNTGTLQLPVLSNPKTIGFILSRTTNTTAKDLIIEVSTTSASAGFTSVATYNNSNTTSGGNTTISVTFADDVQNAASVWVRLRKASSTTSPWRVDNLTINCIGTSTWTNGSWIPAAPDATKKAIVKSALSTQTAGNISALDLTVNSTGSVHVTANTTLTVANGITNQAVAENFIVDDNGAIVQTNNVANSGSITVHKNSSALYRQDYTLWSAPTSGAQTLGSFSPNTVETRFYEYDAKDNGSGTYVEAYYHAAPATTTFTPAHSYLIRMPNGTSSSAATYINGTATLVVDGQFIGTPNNGTITRALSMHANKFTATGNPYPSPIGVSEFFSANSSVIDAGSGIYLWRKKNSGTTGSYATVTNASYAFNTGNGTTTGGQSNAEYFTGASSTWRIAPGQGFIVKTNSNATGTPMLTFNNSMRKAAPGSGGQSFFRAGAGEGSVSRYWINITNSTGDASQFTVAYLDDATNALDYGYDAIRLTENNTVAAYTIAEAKDLTIQARPGFTAEDIVAVGYTAPVAGTYTVSLSNSEGTFAEGQGIYIKDNSQNVVRELSATNSYTFTTEAGTFNERFEIVYTNRTLDTDNPAIAANVAIFRDKSGIVANAGTAIINGIEVYDIQGRRLYANNKVNTANYTVTNLTASHEVLIVKVATDKGTVSKKIIF